jgi:hypothetical protein
MKEDSLFEEEFLGWLNYGGLGALGKEMTWGGGHSA